ncbi:MAG: hypothetical protein J5666_04465 [Bacilli bacterium]|nr:hypothetical protein [Bacilli bacterium]
MNKKINLLPLLLGTSLLLTSCYRTAKDLIVTGDYFLKSEEQIVLKNVNFNSSNPDKYKLELTYVHINITEVTYEEYNEIDKKNTWINNQIANDDTKFANERQEIFTPQDEYIYFTIDFYMGFNLYSYDTATDTTPTLEPSSHDQEQRIYGTHIGRYNHSVNTYYFLLDIEDPSYKGASGAGTSASACLLAALFIENPQEIQVRLSSRIGGLYSTSERWNKMFDLEYQEVEPEPDPVNPEGDE